MRVIREDLQCTAVRITGGDPDRLEIAAAYAADAGLEVWFCPFTNGLSQDALLELLATRATPLVSASLPSEFAIMSQSPAPDIREAQRSARMLVIEHMTWLVYELPAMPWDRQCAPSLLFESDTFVRRVRHFPAGWRALTDDELLALSWAS